MHKEQREIDRLIRYAARIAADGDRIGFVLDREFRNRTPAAADATSQDAESLRRQLGRDAERGIHDLRIEDRPDGSGRVTIDQTHTFELQPAPMRLFDLLAEAVIEDRDRLLSRDELTELLGGQPGAVNNNVYRIREAMRKVGLNDYLLQRTRDGDTRLILARNAIVKRSRRGSIR